MNEENVMQNESVAFERITDIKLRHKVNLKETKKGGSMQTCSPNMNGFGDNNDIKTEQMIKTIKIKTILIYMHCA